MCLGIPGKIISIGKDFEAEVNFDGVLRRVQLDLMPNAKIGDYVIVHAGFAIETVSAEEACETLQLVNEAFNKK